MRKLEELLCDANTRNEDLQKTVNEVTAAKNRLTGDWWRSHINTWVTLRFKSLVPYLSVTSSYVDENIRGDSSNVVIDITSPFPPSGNEGYVRNRDVWYLLLSSKDALNWSKVTV